MLGIIASGLKLSSVQVNSIAYKDLQGFLRGNYPSTFKAPGQLGLVASD